MSETPSDPYVLRYDAGTIKHLGIQMYSTLPSVIGEFVSNAWDADAERVDVLIPDVPLSGGEEIVITDNGCGMSDEDVRKRYFIVGRDRREEEGDHPTPIHDRPLMGRKGIGKFAAFGVAREMEVETIKDGQHSRFIMKYDKLMKQAKAGKIELNPLPPTGLVSKGTRITLRNFTKYRTRRVDVTQVRRRLARRFSIIGQKSFSVEVCGKEIGPDDRDLKRALAKDETGRDYLWEIDEEIEAGTGWRVEGWIGAMPRTGSDDDVQRGIAVMARGKLVQEPFVFNAVVGQQYALSYLIGELSAEFVDAEEDTIATARNTLVWDTEANRALMNWGERKMQKIAREWAERRRNDNEAKLEKLPAYVEFKAEAERIGNKRLVRVADSLVKQVISRGENFDEDDVRKVAEFCLDYMQYDLFRDLASDLADSEDLPLSKVFDLFSEWELLEAKEMMRVTEGRVQAIRKLQKFIDENAKEVPTLHNFLKEFPWVLDPRWTLVSDETRYSDLLRERFPESEETPEEERRIDFLCVRENRTIVVVEIKRPEVKASLKQLEQLEDYVGFVKELNEASSDPEVRSTEVVGYLLCKGPVGTTKVKGRVDMMASQNMYVRSYNDLLGMAERSHKEFLDRYDKISSRKARI